MPEHLVHLISFRARYPTDLKHSLLEAAGFCSPPQAAARNAGLRLAQGAGQALLEPPHGPLPSALPPPNPSAAGRRRRSDCRGTSVRRPAAPPPPCPPAPASPQGPAAPARRVTERCRPRAREREPGQRQHGPVPARSPLPFPKGAAEAGGTPRGCGRGKERKQRLPPAGGAAASPPPPRTPQRPEAAPKPPALLTRKRLELVP